MQRTISLPLAEERARNARNRNRLIRERALAAILGFLAGVTFTIGAASSMLP